MSVPSPYSVVSTESSWTLKITASSGTLMSVKDTGFTGFLFESPKKIGLIKIKPGTVTVCYHPQNKITKFFIDSSCHYYTCLNNVATPITTLGLKEIIPYTIDDLLIEGSSTQQTTEPASDVSAQALQNVQRELRRVTRALYNLASPRNTVDAAGLAELRKRLLPKSITKGEPTQDSEPSSPIQCLTHLRDIPRETNPQGEDSDEESILSEGPDPTPTPPKKQEDTKQLSPRAGSAQTVRPVHTPSDKQTSVRSHRTKSEIDRKQVSPRTPPASGRKLPPRLPQKIRSAAPSPARAPNKKNGQVRPKNRYRPKNVDKPKDS